MPPWLALFIRTMAQHQSETINCSHWSYGEFKAFSVRLFSVALTLLSYKFVAATIYLSVKLPEIAKLETLQEVVEYYNYPAHTFNVQTADGYRLILQRIPRAGAHPVLLMHGLGASAFFWLMNGPATDLAFLLHDRGYDVWLGNVRGTTYGRQHATLNADTDEQFWNYDWHEIGIHDLPAIIDTILLETGAPQLSYVGHSQGCTAFFVMAALRPEYNRKIKLKHALAPAVYISHARSTLLSLSENLIQQYKYPFAKEHTYGQMYRKGCLLSKYALNYCLQLMGRVAGDHLENINETVRTMLVYKFPAGLSERQLAHYHQVYKTDIFAPLDEGFWQGEPVNQSSVYPLEKVSTPVALYYCANDLLVDTEDVRRLARELPNVVEDYLVPGKRWNHLDPQIGMDARPMLYEHLLEVQKKYENDF